MKYAMCEPKHEQPLTALEKVDAPGATISILSRIDYRIEDIGRLLEEGRKAYRRTQPDAGPEEVHEAVPDVQSAIYEIMHANGDRIPFPFPSGVPIAGVTWFLEVDEALGKDVHSPPEEPFGVACKTEDGELIYQHRDIYHLTAEALESASEPGLHLGE
ncbi:hypothetical protein [Nonomuraea sp. NPDC001831]|uniref:hypothetical protein n=1 Tax=Nonomuraea sp. NPDC001831 TaxID=3364340 RepID=UPI0036B2030A